MKVDLDFKPFYLLCRIKEEIITTLTNHLLKIDNCFIAHPSVNNILPLQSLCNKFIIQTIKMKVQLQTVTK